MDRDSERYALMSAVEKNTELKRLYLALPNQESIFPNEEPTTEESISGNEDAEPSYRSRLVEKLNSLLPFAFISEGGKQYLSFEYENYFQLGVIKELEEALSTSQFNMGDIFRWNNYNNQGGIFQGKALAKSIERELHIWISKILTQDKQLYSQINSRLGIDDLTPQEILDQTEGDDLDPPVIEIRRIAQRMIKRDNIFRRWQVDIITHYSA